MEIDLENAGFDLSGANLKGTSLKNAKLQGVILKDARLNSATNLQGADLQGAIVHGHTSDDNELKKMGVKLSKKQYEQISYVPVPRH